jgi:crotonobetainyl-CoA:carnitine CoA-transferase CaiB-like acyl-CoA transferase
LVVKAGDRDRAAREEAVPARRVAEHHRRHLAARRDFTAEHLAVEQRHDALQWADPLHRATAPLHRLGPWQRLQGGIDDAGQRVGGRTTLLVDHGKPELTLAGVALLGLVERD